MTQEIVIGTIVMEDRPAITQALELECESFSGGWGMLKTIGAQALELKVGAAGWRCFFLAGEIKATVFGSGTLLNNQRALRCVLKKVHQENFNCFEVTRITGGNFCGIPYTTIGGHPRHLQQAWVLQGAKARLSAQTDADWARG